MTSIFGLHPIFFSQFFITLLFPYVTTAAGNVAKNIGLLNTNAIPASNVSQGTADKPGKSQNATNRSGEKLQRPNNVSRAEVIELTPIMRPKEIVSNITTFEKKKEEKKLTGESGAIRLSLEETSADSSLGSAFTPPKVTIQKGDKSDKKSKVGLSQNERSGSDTDLENMQDEDPGDRKAARAGNRKEELSSLESPEDSHFIYYLVFFGVIVAVFYITAHNKKKILGLIVEGRRPPSGSRRTSVRYHRLSQRDDTDITSCRDAGSNIIY